MSDVVAVALISAIPAIFSKVLDALVFLKHAKEIKLAIVDTKSDIKLLEKNTNSIKDELVRVTGESEFAKGVKSEIDRAATSPALSQEK